MIIDSTKEGVDQRGHRSVPTKAITEEKNINQPLLLLVVVMVMFTLAKETLVIKLIIVYGWLSGRLAS